MINKKAKLQYLFWETLTRFLKQDTFLQLLLRVKSSLSILWTQVAAQSESFLDFDKHHDHLEERKVEKSMKTFCLFDNFFCHMDKNQVEQGFNMIKNSLVANQ